MVIMVVSADGAGKRGRGMVTTGYGAGTLGKYGGGGEVDRYGMVMVVNLLSYFVFDF